MKGAPARGKRYEKRVIKQLSRRQLAGRLSGCKIEAGNWYAFKDANGAGCCQTDIELHYENVIVLLECKLTQTDGAIPQMLELYVPVLEMQYGKPVISVQVCKNLRYHPGDLIGDIDEIIKRPKQKLYTWHYRAKS